MKKLQIIKYIIFIIVAIVLVCIDQFTKKVAKMNLLNNEPKVLIKNILELVYTENRGAAFGILQGRQYFFYGLTIVVFIILIFMLYKLDFTIHNACYFIVLCLIFSGALGNFIDRIANKYVVDFIYFKPIDFPVFNFADIYITCGCILMIVSLLTIYKKD